MKNFLFVPLAVLVLFGFAGTSFAIPMSTDDLWDVSKGSTVTATSGILTPSSYWGSFPEGMFGGYNTSYIEPSNTIFADYQAAGTTHWIEWQSLNAMTLRSFNLVASHDGAGNINKRGFTEFRLFARSNPGDSWTSVYTYATDPDNDSNYGGGTTYTNTWALELGVDLSSAITAQYFRAEFDQAGSPSNASGPRILELDGYDTFLDGTTPVPEPATMLLFGTGLAGLAGFRTRKRRQ